MEWDNLLEAGNKGDTDAQVKLGEIYFFDKGSPEDKKIGMNYFLAAAQRNNYRALYNIGYIYYYIGFPEKDFFKAIRAFEKASELGDTDAMFYLSEMYILGKGIEKDIEKGLEWLKRSAELENKYAQNRLALYYVRGDFVHPDNKKAFFWFEKAAKQEYGLSMFYLASMYLEGRGCEKNIDLAMEWMKKSAETGYVDAQFELADLYFSLNDTQNALYWLKKSAEGDYAEAQNQLGTFYCEGECFDQDFIAGKYWYERAAKNGNTDAMMNLSLMYKRGEGVEIDQRKAFEWMLKAAQCGEVDAQVRVGARYAEGEGTEVDYAQAKYWFEEAEKKNDPNAICYLGLLYWRGWGVEKDKKVSNQYMKRAAELGSTAAMVNYARSLIDGDELVPNREEGIRWLRKATENGNPEGASALYWEIRDSEPEEAFECLKMAAKGGVTGTLEYLISLMALSISKVETTGGKIIGNSVGRHRISFQEYNNWLDLGIERDMPIAYNKKGNELIRGIYLPQDVEKGIQYIFYAAERKYSSAMLKLANYYKDGFEPYIHQNIGKAIFYLRNIIENNHPDEQNGSAEYLLGEIYINAQYGVNKRGEAIDLWEKASDYGYILADRKLALLFSDGTLIDVNPDKAIYYAKRYLDRNGWDAAELYNNIYIRFFQKREIQEERRTGNRGFFRFFKK